MSWNKLEIKWNEVQRKFELTEELPPFNTDILISDGTDIWIDQLVKDNHGLRFLEHDFDSIKQWVPYNK